MGKHCRGNNILLLQRVRTAWLLKRFCKKHFMFSEEASVIRYVKENFKKSFIFVILFLSGLSFSSWVWDTYWQHVTNKTLGPCWAASKTWTGCLLSLCIAALMWLETLGPDEKTWPCAFSCCMLTCISGLCNDMFCLQQEVGRSWCLFKGEAF